MKPKRIRKYQTLEGDLKKLFDNTYKDGFNGLVMDFTDPRDQHVFKAVPIETDEFYYLINIESILKASALDDDDDDMDADDDDSRVIVDDIEVDDDEDEDEDENEDADEDDDMD